MNDVDLIETLRAVIQVALDDIGWEMPIVQRSQPTQQGQPNQSTVYFQKMFDTYYGWPETKTLQDTPTLGAITEVTTQYVETTFQVSVLSILTPTMDARNQATASDISNQIAMRLRSRKSIRLFGEKEIGMLRFTKVSNDYFEDDRHRNEAWPVFELVLTYKKLVSSTVDHAGVGLAIYRV